MTNDRILSVSIKDCNVSTFSPGGAGGQHKDHGNSGVRIVHPQSGAVGVASDGRSGEQNRKNAFIRMANSPVFINWVNIMTGKIKSEAQLQAEVERDMLPENLKVETKENGKWQTI